MNKKISLIGIIGILFILTFGCIAQISEADDTDINSPQEKQVLQYIGGKWINTNIIPEVLLDMNVAGASGQMPFLNLDGNLLEVGGLDFNKDTNTLSTGCIELGDGNSYCSSTDFPNPDLSAFVPFQGADADLNLGLNSIFAKRFSGAVVIPYGVSSSSKTTTTKQVTIPNFTAQAGDIFAVKFTNGSTIISSWDLFVSGVNLGKVYVNGSTATSDYLNVGTGGVILFYYDGARVNAIGTTYTNPFDRLSLNRSNARPVETIYGWKVAMEDGAGRFRPIIKTIGSTGNNDYPNTAGFKLNGYMVLNDSATNYGTTSSMNMDFTSNGVVGTAYNLNSLLTNYLPLYWKGTVKSDGLFYFDQASYTSWYTQALPTTEDGFVYIFVGWATSTYSFFIVPNHPAYWFKNGKIRLYGEYANTDRQDNFEEYFGTDNDSSITFDGTNLVLDPDTTGTDSGLVYVDGNVSATGFITRTSVYDKSKGSALDKIKDADSLVNVDKSIIHENFFGYTPIQVTDYSRPVIITKDVKNCFFDEKDKEFCEIKKVSTTTYPYTKIEGGVDLGMEIDVLRQAVFELKTELCKKDSSYEWCKVIK